MNDSHSITSFPELRGFDLLRGISLIVLRETEAIWYGVNTEGVKWPSEFTFMDCSDFQITINLRQWSVSLHYTISCKSFEIEFLNSCEQTDHQMPDHWILASPSCWIFQIITDKKSGNNPWNDRTRSDTISRSDQTVGRTPVCIQVDSVSQGHRKSPFIFSISKNDDSTGIWRNVISMILSGVWIIEEISSSASILSGSVLLSRTSQITSIPVAFLPGVLTGRLI